MNVMFVIAGNTLIGKSQMEAPHYPHIGLAYMTSILQEHDFDISIVDMRLRYSFDELSNFIKKNKPKVIGVSLWSLFYLNAYNLVDYIKEAHPGITTILGGPHIAAAGKQVLDESVADFALNGEGEYAFLEFCQALSKGQKDFSDIDGLIWRKDGAIIANKPRPYITELDKLPFPNYEKFELDRYMSVKERNLLPIITSRGCPYRCVFCGIKLTMGRPFRPRSAENVVDEFEYWTKKGFKTFDINDDNFTHDIERAKQICSLIKERNLNIQYRFVNGIRADKLDQELADKLKETGCIYVSFGVETGNPEIMKKIKKGVSFTKIKQAIELANKIGWVNQTNYIIGHPEESYEKAMDTIKLAREIPSTFVSFANAIPYPGTELYDWVVKNGRLLYPYEHYLNNIEYGDVNPIFETDNFSIKERRKVLRLGVRLSRKRFVQFILGKYIGNLVYPFVGYDRIWARLITIFQGNVWGFKIFRFFIKNKIQVEK